MRALGIVLAGGSSRRMKELSENRAVTAMPVAGSYRCIDFVLSSMTNSGIDKVGVLAQYNSRSLQNHLASAKWWNFGRKRGGLYMLTPILTSSNSFWYRGTADSIYRNIDWLKESHEPYVVIASGDGVYKVDYNKVLEYHIAKGADITVVCTEAPADPKGYGVVCTNKDGRITEFEEKPLEAASNTISCGIYVIRRRLLIELLEECAYDDKYDFVNDIIIRGKRIRKVYAYPLTGYWGAISSIEDYYRVNMDFLKMDVRKFFFGDEPAIYSKVSDNPPAKYNQNCFVKNSLISNGCIINGTVEDSVLFKNVYVGENCVIKNCIILNDIMIGDNTRLENCIIDSHSTVLANTEFKGEPGNRVLKAKNNRYDL